jgi:predicted regulator of Ras-like GTPase activity (Roadblock/LC7/MglB family)
MSELEAALARLRGHPGVEQLILLGSDGLVIQQIDGPGEEETVAARIPGIAAACESLGRASGTGRFATAVLEFEQGVVIACALSPELLLAARIQPGIGFAALLRELRRERAHLIELI